MNKLQFQQFQQIDELLKKAENILIASHENPDPDAVGSVLALRLALKAGHIYLPDPPSPALNFLPGFNEIKTFVPSIDFDLIFCLDYGDFKKLRLPEGIKGEIITIDHHLESDQRGSIKIVEPSLSSTSEIIYLWLKDSITKDIATCLLAGIISDSGGFSHISTSSQTLKIASRLLSMGAPLPKIVQKTLSLENINCSKIWAQALSRVTEDKENGLTFSWVSHEDIQRCQAEISDIDGIASLISNASSTNLSLFLVEYKKGEIKGSLRSEPYRGKGVVALAKALGGGGHLYAAGFRQKGTIEEVLKNVYKLARSID